MIKAGYYARVDYTILKEFLSIQRPLNQHVTGNYKRVLSFVFSDQNILSREIYYIILTDFLSFLINYQRSKMELFLFFFSL